jgi:hypothetical protein
VDVAVVHQWARAVGLYLFFAEGSGTVTTGEWRGVVEASGCGGPVCGGRGSRWRALFAGCVCAALAGAHAVVGAVYR